jgi:hypothetical protein
MEEWTVEAADTVTEVQVIALKIVVDDIFNFIIIVVDRGIAGSKLHTVKVVQLGIGV